MKLGRNDKCWCGSGEKYKKCHLKREEMDRIERQDIEKHSKKIDNIKYCSVPNEYKHECSKKMIKAHTISKSSSLKSISKNGHVMGLNISYSSIDRNQGRAKLEKIGINSASTFNGFCAFHDRTIFSPIENDIFVPSHENCFLVAYRAICREFYTKKNQLETFNFIKNMDKGFNVDKQIFVQSFINANIEGATHSLSEIDYIKTAMDDVLISKCFHKMKHLVFELKDIPQVNVSSSIFIDYDFDGNQLQSLAGEKLESVVFNCFSSGNNGYFIYSWLDSDTNIVEDFLMSLVSKENINDYLVAFLFSYTENIYCSIDWWNGLQNEIKNKSQLRILEGVHPEFSRKGNELSVPPPKYNAFQIETAYYLFNYSRISVCI